MIQGDFYERSCQIDRVGSRVRNLGGVTIESHPCSGCGTDLVIPALSTPNESGESWWCEKCVRRTLQAIEEAADDPDGSV